MHNPNIQSVIQLGQGRGGFMFRFRLGFGGQGGEGVQVRVRIQVRVRAQVGFRFGFGSGSEFGFRFRFESSDSGIDEGPVWFGVQVQGSVPELGLDFQFRVRFRIWARVPTLVWSSGPGFGSLVSRVRSGVQVRVSVQGSGPEFGLEFRFGVQFG